MQPEILDLLGVARHCRVAKTTPQQWRRRGVLPPPDFPDIIHTPIWRKQTIKEWAARTGRQWVDDPDDDVEEFAEEDESVAEVEEAFERGEKGMAAPPLTFSAA